METQFWNHGEKARVARMAGITPQALNDILSGTQPCGRDRARRLEAATLLALGKDRVVPLPCSMANELRAQVECARGQWQKDQAARIPVALPSRLASSSRPEIGR